MDSVQDTGAPVRRTVDVPRSAQDENETSCDILVRQLCRQLDHYAHIVNTEFVGGMFAPTDGESAMFPLKQNVNI